MQLEFELHTELEQKHFSKSRSFLSGESVDLLRGK